MQKEKKQQPPCCESSSFYLKAPVKHCPEGQKKELKELPRLASSAKFKLAIICGGPSPERGISLNSARSIMDHSAGDGLEIVPLYVDTSKQFYLVSKDQLYSNTPKDFDFKLASQAVHLNEEALKAIFESVDLVFPAIHGSFGEDGELQAILEKHGVPFVGHTSASCRKMFRKSAAYATLAKEGFDVFPHLVLSKQADDVVALVENFFQELEIERAIVKPVQGGSSIGVHSVSTASEALLAIRAIFDRGLDDAVLLEPFCLGTEFTVVVFQNKAADAVALLPTEVELAYDNHAIFDYRKKYLPTNQAIYHTPARFPKEVVDKIRSDAERIFQLFDMSDFARIDGWVTKEGSIYFTDINPISGLEQNSFLFRQSSLLGMTHRETLSFLLNQASQRQGLSFPIEQEISQEEKKNVFVLFGGDNAERQVSLMSGTNVWLKLLRSPRFAPTPFFVDGEGLIWKLPYSVALNHTVEEVFASCNSAELELAPFANDIASICSRLNIEFKKEAAAYQMKPEAFLAEAKNSDAFVFIALHGGEGENGVWQERLERAGLVFNGSGSTASSLCMDKLLTGKKIADLQDEALLALPKEALELEDFRAFSKNSYERFWSEVCQKLGSSHLIIKPRMDGCSAGIVLLSSAADLERYFSCVFAGVSSLAAGLFAQQAQVVEMPASLPTHFLLEPYIETDKIFIEEHRIEIAPKTGWLELTIGVLEVQKCYFALNPSITLAEGSVLSLEEKFQGGTGINLTPPPEELLSCEAVQKIKKLAEKAAKALGIENYARLDLFFNRLTEKFFLIEANSLPALTPSTVIYHQGMAENPPLSPLALLEHIILSKLKS